MMAAAIFPPAPSLPTAVEAVAWPALTCSSLCAGHGPSLDLDVPIESSQEASAGGTMITPAGR